MDLATVIGLLIAWAAVFICLVLEGGTLQGLLNLPAFILVLFGTIGATMASFPMRKIIGLVPVVKNAFFSKTEDPGEIIRQLVEFTRKARREGILVLEEEARQQDNRILRSGLQLIVDGSPEEVVRGILETDVIAMQERHREGAKVFDTMGGFSPTLGVIGTVMGLIHMLENLSEPDKMGHMIAAAFVATLYGVAFANLVYLPIGQKLKSRTAEEVANYEMMIEGLLAIQAGDNPRIVEAKMLAFCPPSVRDTVTARESA